MIDFLKNYLVQKNIGGYSTLDAFDIIKTQNGEGHINKKAVFYVFKNKEARPFLVIYTARNKEVNYILEKSIEVMNTNSDFAPKIVFEDYYNGIFFAGVEFLEADKLSLENQTDLSIALDYLASNYKNTQSNTTKKIGDFYSDIREYFHKIDIDIEPLVGKYLNNFKDINLPVLKQHGDFQDNNLFVVSGRLKIIDWDNYGMIDFPFFDFLNLYLKCKRKKQNFEFVEKKWQEISEKYDVDIKIFLLFYYLYDFLRKDAVHDKFGRAEYLVDLKNNLNKVSNKKY